MAEQMDTDTNGAAKLPEVVQNTDTIVPEESGERASKRLKTEDSSAHSTADASANGSAVQEKPSNGDDAQNGKIDNRRSAVAPIKKE